VGELDLLSAFDRAVAVPDTVCAEVTTEPARANVGRFVDGHAVETDWTDDALRVTENPRRDGRVAGRGRIA
jgi:hypothetical protein